MTDYEALLKVFKKAEKEVRGSKVLENFSTFDNQDMKCLGVDCKSAPMIAQFFAALGQEATTPQAKKALEKIMSDARCDERGIDIIYFPAVQNF